MKDVLLMINFSGKLWKIPFLSEKIMTIIKMHLTENYVLVKPECPSALQVPFE